MVSVTIPGIPPSVNHRWRPTGRGGYYVGRDTTGWQNDVAMLLSPRFSAEDRESWQQAIQAGAIVRVTMTWHRPDRRRRDTSNAIKAIEDAIVGVIGVDDQWFEWTTHRAYDRQNPRVDLTIACEPVA